MMPAGETKHCGDVVFVTGKHDAERRHLIDAGVGRVQRSRQIVKAHIAADMVPECGC
jgi:hypothetical protein